jgi:hypothetical protein
MRRTVRQRPHEDAGIPDRPGAGRIREEVRREVGLPGDCAGGSDATGRTADPAGHGARCFTARDSADDSLRGSSEADNTGSAGNFSGKRADDDSGAAGDNPCSSCPCDGINTAAGNRASHQTGGTRVAAGNATCDTDNQSGHTAQWRGE